jgi:hypothetical protein
MRKFFLWFIAKAADFTATSCVVVQLSLALNFVKQFTQYFVRLATCLGPSRLPEIKHTPCCGHYGKKTRSRNADLVVVMHFFLDFQFYCHDFSE